MMHDRKLWIPGKVIRDEGKEGKDKKLSKIRMEEESRHDRSVVDNTGFSE